MKEAIYHTVKRVGEDSYYTIGDRKYQKQKEKWEIIKTIDYSAPQPKATDPTESILSKIEEFTSTDMDLSLPQVEDFDYFELLAEVKRLGVEVTGNPKRTVLEELYKEATG